MSSMNKKPKKISLPTYPFAREKYWVDGIVGDNLSINNRVMSQQLHPLLHENTSSFNEQRFSSLFYGSEFFLSDHVINGNKLIPGAAYLEMVRAAVERATEIPVDGSLLILFKNVIWARPVTVSKEPVRVHVGLSLGENNAIFYEVYTESTGDENIIHSQGSIEICQAETEETVDLNELQSRKWKNSVSAEKCYEIFNELGIEYGPGLRGIETIYFSNDTALAKLSMPASVITDEKKYVLHPSIMDSAFQSIIGLLSERKSGKAAMPFAIDEVTIYDKCDSSMWAVLTYSEKNKDDKVDISLINEKGKICVGIHGLTLRLIEGEAKQEKMRVEPEVEVSSAHNKMSEKGIILIEPEWKDFVKKSISPHYFKRMVFLCEFTGDIYTGITDDMKSHQFVNLNPDHDDQKIEIRYENYAKKIIGEIRDIILSKPEGKVLLQLIVNEKKESLLFAGLSGILKTARQENPNLVVQVIELEKEPDVNELAEIIKENTGDMEENHVRYRNGIRQIKGLKEIEADHLNKKSDATGDKKQGDMTVIPWKDSGVYLITGGAGGLGKIFALDIAGKVKDPVIILTGRSRLSPEKETWIKELGNKGAKVIYNQVDVTRREEVKKLIEGIQNDYGKLNGIIHSAGVIKDNFIIKKNNEEIEAVLAPKVKGTINLDIASSESDLDLFIMFSSSSGLLGNPGQADYSCANAFMDAYSVYRNEEVTLQRKHGRTISINWPLWREGGMNIDGDIDRMIERLSMIGIDPLKTETGIRVLYEGIKQNKNQIMVFEGDLDVIREMFFSVKKSISKIPDENIKEEAAGSQYIESDLLKEKTIVYLKNILSKIIKLPVEKIRADVSFEHYGVDSLMIMQLTNHLENEFGSLSKTLFFEYQDLLGLSGYFIKNFHSKLINLFGLGDKKNGINYVSDGAELHDGANKKSYKNYNRFLTRSGKSEGVKQESEIAIIGLSGRYPGARNIREFWENLKNGKDCVTEIPDNRWDWRKHFDPDKNKQGTTYSKWGGFIDGVWEFDPLFFHILPNDAVSMDPQERIFLECVYRTLEDAGYTTKSLKQDNNEVGANVGVYVGVMYEEHQLYGAQEQARGRMIALGGFSSSVANRVSYLFNFIGPSIAVNSMCSSSLTTIHLACQALRNGECETAIAGGVNVSIHPNKYFLLSQGNFVSSKGRCESFGKGGDGYVPGEGVGAVLLKPLSKAIADNDHIYGVIKGSVLNAGGKTTGYTVPNPAMQADVIRKTIKKAGLKARSISFIEAHGTGTILGDPIEIDGLTRAFRDDTDDNQFCAIGSVKSNIGHCESAAGIASVSKVLLQMKYGQLVPSLHAEELNPNIDFKSTPFVVQRNLSEWNGDKPRIAGISAFGAGGANAHMIIEEYREEREGNGPYPINPQNPVLIVLSGRDKTRLTERVKDLLDEIKKEKFG
ncbi:MAG: SDR family NAD(P)-dependent oxidoreductase, partial [Spirochaetales bacterium]|nr:SDR family NAD(P)-dependent oxidoreductase [Spirochaetales bacterium]